MADLRTNRRVWTETWDWAEGGEEWSSSWGGTQALWYQVLLPRIHAFVPTGTILELGPGHGRWSQYLKDLAGQLILVDLAPNCIEECRRRFASASNIDYQVTDGSSLTGVGDRSVDFVFTFDSLVHSDPDTIDAYLAEIRRTLSSQGVAFIHHSNLGSFPRWIAWSRRVPAAAHGLLRDIGLVVDLQAWRDEQMTGDTFSRLCEVNGLSCIIQESIPWEHGFCLSDTLSVVTVKDSRFDRPQQVVKNWRFRAESRRLDRLYGFH